VLRLSRSAYDAMLAHAYAGFPDEACGLLGGTGDDGNTFIPTRNADASSRTFSIDGLDQMKAEQQLDDAGEQLLGVVHSHTHTDAYPSPTDVEKASNPFLAGWRWLLVSLKHPEPVVRSYVVEDGRIIEEEILLAPR
jgi:[CysO sulfur-carrier protein]-S-L-cysteine hydrolase